MTPRQLTEALAGLPAWHIVTSEDPTNAAVRHELHRTFKCRTFDDALAFMRAAAPFINATDHHPRWENVYSRVDVWLSTHDAGNVVTQLDIDLARHLDDVFRDF